MRGCRDICFCGQRCRESWGSHSPWTDRFSKIGSSLSGDHSGCQGATSLGIQLFGTRSAPQQSVRGWKILRGKVWICVPAYLRHGGRAVPPSESGVSEGWTHSTPCSWWTDPGGSSAKLASLVDPWECQQDEPRTLLRGHRRWGLFLL